MKNKTIGISPKKPYRSSFTSNPIKLAWYG